MSQSPYTPPTSDLTPHQIALPARPKAIFWAANLIFLDCVMGLLYLVPGVATPEELDDGGAFIFAMVFGVLILALLVWSGFGILKGKNGARWIVLTVFALSLLIATTSSSEPNHTIVRRVIDWGSILMEAGVAVLLLLGTSRQWFKDCKDVK